MPDSITRLDSYAFYDCDALTSVTIPGSVTTIGESAFRNCDVLASVTLREGLKTISSYAFYECPALDEVTIPASVKTIGTNAFDAHTVTPVDEYYVDANGVTFTSDRKTLVKYPSTNTSTSYEIPDGVTSISDEAFSGCQALTTVTIPDSLHRIEFNAFIGCIALQKIVLPSSLNEIDCWFDGRGVAKMTTSNPSSDDIIKKLKEGYTIVLHYDGEYRSDHWD